MPTITAYDVSAESSIRRYPGRWALRAAFLVTNIGLWAGLVCAARALLRH